MREIGIDRSPREAPPSALVRAAVWDRRRDCFCPEAIARRVRYGLQVTVGFRAEGVAQRILALPWLRPGATVRTLRLTVASTMRRVRSAACAAPWPSSSRVPLISDRPELWRRHRRWSAIPSTSPAIASEHVRDPGVGGIPVAIAESRCSRRCQCCWFTRLSRHGSAAVLCSGPDRSGPTGARHRSGRRPRPPPSRRGLHPALSRHRPRRERADRGSRRPRHLRHDARWLRPRDAVLLGPE